MWVAAWLSVWLVGLSGAPWAIGTTMHQWAIAQAPRELPERVRLERLHAALVGQPGLAIAEERGFTATATEAFLRKKANCVAFALLFAGLARDLGVDVEFALDQGIREIERRADLRVLHGHLAVQWRQGRETWLIDAQGFFHAAPGEFVPVPDATVRAIFLSNRGTELLIAGHNEPAGALLDLALRWDPRLDAARRNRAVLERRAARSVPPPLAASASLAAGSGLLARDGDH